MSENKQDKVWVLVEAVSMFRLRYVVEAPKDHPEYALDTVVMNDATEFSQKHLDEVITSHRVISEQEALELADQDDDFVANWDTETKLENLFTRVED